METDGNHSRRTFLKAAGGTVAAVSMAGCTEALNGGGGDDGGPSGKLRYSRGAKSKTLDVHTTTSGEDAKLTNQIYDKLIHFKPGMNEITGGLAKDYEMSGKTATVTLREDVTFHDGEELTAADFKATYRRFTDKNYEHFVGEENQSSYAAISYGQVKSVTVNGDYEIEFELKAKFAPFLRNLGIFATAVLSKKDIEDGIDFATKANGTGPFKLEQYESKGKKILLTANEEYWGDVPKVENVIFDVVTENSTRAQSLFNDETDIIDGIGAESATQVKQQDGVTLKEKEGLITGYMALNMDRFKPFRKKKVRQALNHAVNTQVIVEEILSGFATQSSQPIPSSMPGYNEELDPYPHDKKKAKQLLKEAGHGDGLEFELAVFKNPRPYIPSPIDAAEQVRSDLNEVGVTVKINQNSWEPFLNYVLGGKHDACFLGWMVDNGDPDNFYYSLLHPGVKIPEGQDWVSWDTEGYNTTNASAWANKEFVKLVEKARAITDGKEKRVKAYKKAGKLTHNEAPWVFLNHSKELRGISDAVSGYKIGVVGGPFLNVVSKK